MQQTTIPLFAAYPINGLYSSSFPLLFSRTVMEYNLNNLTTLFTRMQRGRESNPTNGLSASAY